MDPIFPLFRPVEDVVEELSGERPSRSTIWRWRTKGLNGQRLRTTRVGVTVKTTQEWVMEFFNAVANVGTDSQPLTA